MCDRELTERDNLPVAVFNDQKVPFELMSTAFPF